MGRLTIIREGDGSNWRQFLLELKGKPPVLARINFDAERRSRIKLLIDQYRRCELGSREDEDSFAGTARSVTSWILPEPFLVPLATSRDPGLHILTNDSAIPTEFLYGHELFAVKRKCSKEYLWEVEPSPLLDIGRPRGFRALVIADPRGTLPGALQEGWAVYECFRRYGDCDRLFGPDATLQNVMAHLGLAYDFIHLAADIDYKTVPKRSFILMADGRRLFADQVRTLVYGDPIVGVAGCGNPNAGGKLCVSRVEDFPQAFLRGSARGRARAVVGTGTWLLPDEYICGYWLELYPRMLDELPFDEASRLARVAAQESGQGPRVWLPLTLFTSDPAQVYHRDAPAARTDFFAVAEQTPELLARTPMVLSSGSQHETDRPNPACVPVPVNPAAAAEAGSRWWIRVFNAFLTTPRITFSFGGAGSGHGGDGGQGGKSLPARDAVHPDTGERPPRDFLSLAAASDGAEHKDSRFWIRPQPAKGGPDSSGPRRSLPGGPQRPLPFESYAVAASGQTASNRRQIARTAGSLVFLAICAICALYRGNQAVVNGPTGARSEATAAPAPRPPVSSESTTSDHRVKRNAHDTKPARRPLRYLDAEIIVPSPSLLDGGAPFAVLRITNRDRSPARNVTVEVRTEGGVSRAVTVGDPGATADGLEIDAVADIPLSWSAPDPPEAGPWFVEVCYRDRPQQEYRKQVLLKCVEGPATPICQSVGSQK
jgi:hypothetical protein